MPENLFFSHAMTLTVDSGEALNGDGASFQVSRLLGSMLSAGSLAIVLVTNYYPARSVSL